jgi:DNA-binding NarL/FixJ family response regulator
MLLCRSTCCLKQWGEISVVSDLVETNPYSVLVVSSQCTLRLGIASLLTRIRTNVSIVEVAGWQRAIEMLARGDFSAAFFALADGGADAVKFITLIRDSHPRLLLGVFSDCEIADSAVAYLSAGAHGYIHLCDGETETETGVKRILEGRIHISANIRSQPVVVDDIAASRSRAQVRLTERQRTVLSLIRAGRSNKEIAQELDLSPYTVKIHVAALLRFFAVCRREDLDEAALRMPYFDVASSAAFNKRDVVES